MGGVVGNHSVDIREATTHVTRQHTRKQDMEEKAEGPHAEASAQGGRAGVAWGPGGAGWGGGSRRSAAWAAPLGGTGPGGRLHPAVRG